MTRQSDLGKVPFELIDVDPSFNSRKKYQNIKELAESIKTTGLLQPLGVSKYDNEDGETRYKLYFGNRRYLAIELLRKQGGDEIFAEVPVRFLTGTPTDLAFINVRENVDREELTAAEIAIFISEQVNQGLDQREIARRLGRPQSWVSNHFKVRKGLGPAAWTAFEAGRINQSAALLLADVTDGTKQEKALNKILNSKTRSEAKTAAKEASKADGKRKEYANKGAPSKKVIGEIVRDASYDASSEIYSDEERAFYNGVAAGLRAARGEFQYADLKPTEKFADTNYGLKESESKTKENKVKAVKVAKPVGRPKGSGKKKVAEPEVVETIRRSPFDSSFNEADA